MHFLLSLALNAATGFIPGSKSRGLTGVHPCPLFSPRPRSGEAEFLQWHGRWEGRKEGRSRVLRGRDSGGAPVDGLILLCPFWGSCFQEQDG